MCLAIYKLSGNASVTNGMATVAFSGLQCGVTYALIAEGMSNGILVGPASSHGKITTGPCPVMTSEYEHAVAVWPRYS